jgi:hypothetical protein
MSGITVSWVQCANEVETRSIVLEKVIDAIRTGGKKLKLKGQITQIRNKFESELALKGDYKAAKKLVGPLKLQLPGVLYSAKKIARRANEAVEEHSGLICTDLDDLNGAFDGVWTQLTKSPYVMLAFRSPSGDGIKAVFKVVPDISRHRDSFRAIRQYVLQLTGKEIDEKCKDVARMNFMSFDPRIYVNLNAVVIEPLPPEQKREYSSNIADLGLRQQIAVQMFGPIDWEDEGHGFLPCPGINAHTNPDQHTDCKINLDGAPNLFCLHASCRGLIEILNKDLQSRIGKAERQARPSEGGVIPTSNSVDEEILIRLAALPPLEYERVRKIEAEKLKCREPILDKLVEAKRLFLKPNADTLQGKAVVLANVEPWEQAVSGAEVLQETAERFAHYIVLPDGAADMLALWCAHAHCFKCFLCSPRLNATSAEKQSGKTTLRDVIALFVPRPVLTEHMTTAVLFRLVDAQAPTILADEADSWLPRNEELRGLLNAGHRRGGKVLRCEGDNNEVREFDAYAPAVLCGIGNLPGTLHDRSIVVRLKRAKRGEIPTRFDPRHVEVETALCRKLARWTADNLPQLNACDPQLPETAFNRLADNWRPLFAIAEVAGGDWPKRCADALAKLTSRETDEVESLRVMLLADIREIFAGTWPPLPKGVSPSPVERKFSRELIEMLSEMRERPWPEVCHGKPITERWLARNLGAFGIRPKLLRIGDDNRPARGYDKTDFEEAFMRYLPEWGSASVTPLQHEGKHDFSTRYKKENVTDEKTAPYIGKCNTVTLKKGENGETDECDPFLTPPVSKKSEEARKPAHQQSAAPSGELHL